MIDRPRSLIDPLNPLTQSIKKRDLRPAPGALGVGGAINVPPPEPHQEPLGVQLDVHGQDIVGQKLRISGPMFAEPRAQIFPQAGNDGGQAIRPSGGLFGDRHEGPKAPMQIRG